MVLATRYSMVMVMLAEVLLVLCAAQDIASDSQQALAAVSSPTTDPPVMMFEDVNTVAVGIASEYTDPASVEFLKTQAKTRETGKAAMLVLAKLAGTNETAKDALRELSGDSDYSVRRDAVTALGYVDPNQARTMAESLLDLAMPTETRRGAVELLAAIGDAASLEMLRQWRLVEKDPYVGLSLASTLRELEHRLTQVPPDHQASWAEQEIAFWRTLRQSPMFRKVDAENGFAAAFLNSQGRQFSRDFLEHKLRDRNMLAIAIAGYQQEAWAVPFLKPCAGLTGSAGDYARGSLGAIATEEAIRAMEDTIWPGGSTRANWGLLTILRALGDEQTIEKLKNLAATGRFSKEGCQPVRACGGVFVCRCWNDPKHGVQSADYQHLRRFSRPNSRGKRENTVFATIDSSGGKS